jgi:hypothetical protein
VPYLINIWFMQKEDSQFGKENPNHFDEETRAASSLPGSASVGKRTAQSAARSENAAFSSCRVWTATLNETSTC